MNGSGLYLETFKLATLSVCTNTYIITVIPRLKAATLSTLWTLLLQQRCGLYRDGIASFQPRYSLPQIHSNKVSRRKCRQERQWKMDWESVWGERLRGSSILKLKKTLAVLVWEEDSDQWLSCWAAAFFTCFNLPSFCRFTAVFSHCSYIMDTVFLVFFRGAAYFLACLLIKLN